MRARLRAGIRRVETARRFSPPPLAPQTVAKHRVLRAPVYLSRVSSAFARAAASKRERVYVVVVKLWDSPV